MFDLDLNFKEEIIVTGIVLIGFGHRKIFEWTKRFKRFVSE